MARSPFTALAYLLTQGSRDPAIRRIVGSQVAVARALRISPRSLMRYVRGERAAPERIGARLLDLQSEAVAEARAYQRQRARDEGLGYQAPSDLPLRVRRYEHPKLVDGQPEPSDIVTVDVAGLSNADVARVIVTWWQALSKTNQAWDLRLKANIDVARYFGERRRDIQDKSLRRHVAGRSQIELWLPPYPFIFTRPRARGSVRFIRYPNAQAMLQSLNEAFYHRTFGDYGSRLPDDYTFSQLAFIPVTAPRNVKRFQKRKGKR